LKREIFEEVGQREWRERGCGRKIKMGCISKEGDGVGKVTV
jgi:hypothetical protein